MKKKIAITALTVLLAAATAHGSGYRIPEQSANSIALAGAYVAHTMGPDTAYFNPAAMSWQEDAWQVDASLSYVNLKSIKYDDHTNPAKDGGSKTENFFPPLLHVVSKDLNNFRVGFSLAYPAGLSKQWDAGFPKCSTEEFTLKVIEANPTIAYKLCEHMSIAAGLRMLYADGTVKSYATYPYMAAGTSLSRDMDGQTTEFGYNLALSLRPMENWNIGVTYRSKVNLNLSSSDVRLNYTAGGVTAASYNGHGEVSVPVPAVVTVGTSYTIDDTTVEISWDRTFWSKYDHLDFEYSQNFSDSSHPYHAVFYKFDDPVEKNWRNSDCYRIGLTHKCTDRFTAMLGYAIDSNPVPREHIGFEMPDSDAKIYAIGGRYQYSDNLSIGVSYFYCDKESRHATNTASSIDGEFSEAGAHVANVGFVYKF